jgi:hypothetical protein
MWAWAYVSGPGDAAATAKSPVGKTPRAAKKPAKKEEPAAAAGPASPAAAAPAPTVAAASPARPSPAKTAEVVQEGDSPLLVFAVLGVLGALVLYIIYEQLNGNQAVGSA